MGVYTKMLGFAAAVGLIMHAGYKMGAYDSFNTKTKSENEEEQKIREIKDFMLCHIFPE